MSDKTPGDARTDQAVFDDLYRQVHGRLIASLTGLVRDRERAEDLAAAAFQAAWEKRARFRGESSLATWLHAIGFNIARSSWRQERSGRRDLVDRLETSRYAEPDRLSARLEQEELRDRVRRTLDRIAARYRRILVDHYVNGHSVREVARRERVPIGTVLSRLFAARRQLRKAWPATAAPVRGREMPDLRAQQVAEEALKRLAGELQAGRSQAVKTYLAAMGRFRRYSWNNVLLIQAQRPDATRVAGFHTWHDLGRSVRRGEKGIMILAPIRSKEPESAVARAGEKSKDSPRAAGFRAAYVFDVEQTEGRPLPQFATTTGDPKEHLEKLNALVARLNISLEYDASIAPADGQSLGGKILIQPGLSPAEEFSVLAHELAHEMLHRGPERETLSKTVRETQAEAVAYVVSRGIGLETNTSHSDYIALYNGNAKTLAESLAAIQQTSAQILKELLPEEGVQLRENSVDLLARAEGVPHSTSELPSHAPRSVAAPAPEPGESISWDR